MNILDFNFKGLKKVKDISKTLIKKSKYAPLYDEAAGMNSGDILYLRVPTDISRVVFRVRINAALKKGIARKDITFLIRQYDHDVIMVICRSNELIN